MPQIKIGLEVHDNSYPGDIVMDCFKTMMKNQHPEMYKKCNSIIQYGASAMDEIRNNMPVYYPKVEPVGTGMIVALAKIFDCNVTEETAKHIFKEAYSVLANEASKTSAKWIWSLPKIRPTVNGPRSEDIGWFVATHFYKIWNDEKEKRNE